MALRTEDIPRQGVPLFHVSDFGRWERVGRLRTIRYCCVTCDDCKGVAYVIFRPDFVKATQTARVYDPALARQIDRRCHTCAVRVQWQNKSARIYLCYHRPDLMDCLRDAGRKFHAELMDFNNMPEKEKRNDCLCIFPKSCFHMFPTAAATKGSGKVTAERYGDETRRPRPASPPPVPVRRKRKRFKKRHQPSPAKHRYNHKKTTTTTATVSHTVIATAEWKLNALKQILEATNGTPLIVTALPTPTKMEE